MHSVSLFSFAKTTAIPLDVNVLERFSRLLPQDQRELIGVQVGVGCTPQFSDPQGGQWNGGKKVF